MWEYATDLFDASTMERLARHFGNLLSEIVEHPEARLSDLPLLDEAERGQIVVEWNATEVAYPEEHLLPRLLEEQARRTPEIVACTCGSRELTYGELDRRSARLAGRLLGTGGALAAMKGIYPYEELAQLPAEWRVAGTTALKVPGLRGERHWVRLEPAGGVR